MSVKAFDSDDNEGEEERKKEHEKKNMDGDGNVSAAAAAAAAVTTTPTTTVARQDKPPVMPGINTLSQEDAREVGKWGEELALVLLKKEYPNGL